MRSAEIARLAGVTVRTLRHYHQTGILPEPERRSNGYREYTVHDLIRLLRIRRLAALGIPLEAMPALLDGQADEGERMPRPDADATLADLDDALAAQIAHLTAQRDLVARLRAHGVAPDVPVELAPFLAALATTHPSPVVAAQDRDQTVLLAHLAGERGMPGLAAFYERLSAPGVAAVVIDISERFAALGPDSADADVDALVAVFVELLAPIVADYVESAVPVGEGTELLAAYVADTLNLAQRGVLARLEAALGG